MNVNAEKGERFNADAEWLIPICEMLDRIYDRGN
ncbi:MAG: hypothetical protein JWM68_2852 [Verrucomicrobiales bacterium]|nr:hypothetical protein [Verrucomicrobiales bacterium]